MRSLKYILPVLMLFMMGGAVTSCSEDSAEEDEYANWQQRNDEALAKWAASSALRKIKTYSKDAGKAGTSADYIYIEVLETGSGTESPLYTDTVRVAYRGRFIPTASQPDGYVFDQSYIGDFSWKTASTVDGVNWVDGFATALMNMHVGDHWRVYMPYALCYGVNDYTPPSGKTIPGYSCLVFEIAMYDFWHPGTTRPDFK